MNNAVAIVVLAVSVVISAVVIVAAFSLLNSGLGTEYSAVTRLNDDVNYSDALERQLTSKVLSGYDVRYYAKALESESVGIQLVNRTGSVDKISYSIDDMNVLNSDGYVDPSAEYTCRFNKGDNDELLGISFIKVGADDNVVYDHDSALSRKQGSLTAIADRQYELYKKYQENRDKCEDVMNALTEVYRLTEENTKWNMNAGDAEVDESDTDSHRIKNYGELAAKYNGYTDFYNKLAECLRAWTKAGWFDVLYHGMILDFDDTEDNDWSSGSDNGTELGGDTATEAPDTFFDDDDEDNEGSGATMSGNSSEIDPGSVVTATDEPSDTSGTADQSIPIEGPG